MTFLPIVARELRVAARRRSTYWVRTSAAMALVILGIWFFLMMHNEPPQTIAQAVFGVLTGAAVLYCLLSGVRATADCLSEEKREGTLGLMFLTDLKGYDVVFGKLVATSLNAFYGVLAILPLLAVPLLMGGVTLAEFGRMALVALNTLFFSLAIGICVSAVSHSARNARGLTFFLLILFAGLLPALGAWLEFLGKIRRVSPGLLLPSPGFTYAMALDVLYKTGAKGFWWSLLTIHTLAWIFLLLACMIAPRCWQDRPAGAQRLRWRDRWRLWSYGNLVERTAFRQRLLAQNAFFWLAARARLKPAAVWAVLGSLAAAWLWGLFKYQRDWTNVMTYILTGGLLNLLLKGWVGAEAGRQMAEDRIHGTLELLLSTPLSVRDILEGQLLALKRQFLGPLLVILGVFVLFLLAASSDFSREDRALWILFWLAIMVMLGTDCLALHWVGMWQALIAKNPQRAASAGVARVLVLPWIAFALISLVVSLLSIAWRKLEPGPKFFLALWVGLGLATDLGFALWARHKLLSEFRLAAEQRYERRQGFWRRLFASREGHPAAPPPPVIALWK